MANRFLEIPKPLETSSYEDRAIAHADRYFIEEYLGIYYINDRDHLDLPYVDRISCGCFDNIEAVCHALNFNNRFYQGMYYTDM